MRNDAVRLSHAVLAVAAVCLVSGFHGFWSLSACNDDSGAADRTYLDQCWAYDSSGRSGWETEAVAIFLGPPGLVLLGAVFAGAMRMPAVLAWATAVSLTLAVVGFFTAPLYFD